MLCYSVSISPRLSYVSVFIGHEIFGEALQFTNDIDRYKNYDGPKLNYSKAGIISGEYMVVPNGLLEQTGVTQSPIDCFETDATLAFFKTTGDFPFDIFSACFYLLSRYEEYLPHKKDKYGRYAHENSLAFKKKFLDQPLVNKWLGLFKKSLRLTYPALSFRNASFNFLPTYDIDEAWSFKHKNNWRLALATVRAVTKGERPRVIERRKVLKGMAQDPFDSYEWMNALHKKFALKPRYFFLVPEKTGKYDRNILPAEPALQELIREHASQYPVGLHPSWQSGDDPFLIKAEKATLENITGKKIQSSRQHFIRLTLPGTFRYLLATGIREDFSMGYGDINGFRASVCSPFYWYDLEKEETTELLLYPFCYMEANSFFEQKLTSHQALEEMIHYYHEVKAVSGLLITLWHNTFLGTDPMFKGWRQAYEEFVEYVSKNRK
jgi:hypothetical protein